MTKTILILAGGYGERFWPMSRKSSPKQFLKLFGSKSLLRITYERIKELISERYIFIISGEGWETQIQEELPEFDGKNLIKEPYRRDTAFALGFASVFIQKRYKDAGIFVCPSDHMMKDTKAWNGVFKEVIEKGFEEIKKKKLVCIGIKPSRAETGYGYLKLKKGSREIAEVEAFIEKPSKELALQYYQDANYWWNSGMFMWKVDTLTEAIKKHLPSIYDDMIKIKGALGTKEEAEKVKKVSQKAIKISIDNGLMEKSQNITCIKGDFIWDDLGTWGGFQRMTKRDEKGNIERGQTVLRESENTMVLGDDEVLIGGVGLNNLMIIKSKNGILICDQREEQKIKHLLKDIKEKYGKRFL